MKIRKARKKDKKFIKILDKENMAPIMHSYGVKYYGNMFEPFKSKNCFILELSKPIGFAYFDISEKKLDIWSIQIKKEFSRRGFGTKLMKYIIDYARKEGIRKVILEAHKNNKSSVNFYKKIGFKKIKSKKQNKIAFEFITK